MEFPPDQYPMAWFRLSLDPWMAATIISWCTNTPIDMRTDVPSNIRQRILVDRLDGADPWQANAAFSLSTYFIEATRDHSGAYHIGPLDV